MLDSLMDALGYVGDALDKPGRAVRGLLSGNAREGLAALPFSDTLGLTDPGQRTSGMDLLRNLGMDPGDGLGGQLAGFGAELATDPLTLLGGGLGAKLGGKATEAALARGPRFATTADDVGRMVGDSMEGAAKLSDLLQSPQAGKILAEINPESKFLGAGAEGMAFHNPAGDVTRIGPVPAGELGRPAAPGVLSPSMTRDIADTGLPMTWRSERMPFAEDVPNMLGHAYDDHLESLLNQSGLSYVDRKAANLGMLDGKPVVRDPGSVLDLGGYAGPRAPIVNSQDPGAAMNTLLNLLGGDQVARTGGSLTPQLALGGAGAGSLAGAFGRTQAGR